MVQRQPLTSISPGGVSASLPQTIPLRAARTSNGSSGGSASGARVSMPGCASDGPEAGAGRQAAATAPVAGHGALASPPLPPSLETQQGLETGQHRLVRLHTPSNNTPSAQRRSCRRSATAGAEARAPRLTCAPRSTSVRCCSCRCCCCARRASCWASGRMTTSPGPCLRTGHGGEGRCKHRVSSSRSPGNPHTGCRRLMAAPADMPLGTRTGS